MSTFQRTLLALQRRIKKNLIVWLIATIIFSGFYIATLINNVTSTMKLDILSNIRYSFTLKNNDGSISLDEANKALAIKTIQNHNYEYSSLLSLEKPYRLVEKNSINDNNKNEIGAIGVSNSKLFQLFEDRTLTLVKGKHLATNKTDVLIHEEFAKKNNLDINQTFKVNYKGTPLELTVVGIFVGDDYHKAIKPKETIENNIFMNVETLYTLENTNVITKASYYVETQQVLESTVQAVKKLYGENFSVEPKNNGENEIIVSLEALESIVTKFLFGMCIVGTFILSFVLVFALRSRIVEIGILLSIGISKSMILAQMVLEFMIIGCLSLISALALVLALSHYFIKAIIDHFSEFSHLFNSTIAINQSLSLNAILLTFIMGFAIILLSVLIATLPIMIKKPKEILSKIS